MGWHKTKQEAVAELNAHLTQIADVFVTGRAYLYPVPVRSIHEGMKDLLPVLLRPGCRSAEAGHIRLCVEHEAGFWTANAALVVDSESLKAPDYHNGSKEPSDG